MLAFSTLFMSNFKAYAKVVNEPFKTAIARAKGVSQTGSGYVAAYDTAKSEFQAKLAEGKALVVSEEGRATWPKILKVINDHMPDPVAEYHLDPNVPKDVKVLDRLRIHVDKIVPVYRSDVATEWYDTIGEKYQGTIHPLDRTTPPSGEGWIIQLLCHHYNPTTPVEGVNLQKYLQTSEMGPYNYIYRKVLPRFTGPDLRALGIHHVAMTWFTIDKKWTADMGSGGNGISSAATLLGRASAPASTGGGAAGEMGSMMGGMMAGMMSGSGRMGSSGGEMMGGSGGMSMGMMGRGGRMGMPGMPGAATEAQKLVQLTRTDFLLQFVWQPPTAEKPTKTIDEYRAELAAAESDEKNKGAMAAIDISKVEQQLDEESVKGSKNLIKAVEEQVAKANKTATPGTPVAPGTTPGVVPPTTPAPASPSETPATPANPAPGATTPAPG